MTDDLEQLVMRKMGGNPDVNGMGYADDIAAVRDIIALVRASVADDLDTAYSDYRASGDDSSSYTEGYLDGLDAVDRIADLHTEIAAVIPDDPFSKRPVEIAAEVIALVSSQIADDIGEMVPDRIEARLNSLDWSLGYHVGASAAYRVARSYSGTTER